MDYRQSEIYDLQEQKLILEKELLVIEKLKPQFSKDGNQFCFLFGDNLQEGIAGFGETVALAISDFVKNFYIEKAVI